MPDREPLSGADNAWRRMGTPNNLMTITGVMTFDEVVTYDEFCDRLEARLLRFDRFKQFVGGRNRTILRPYWQEISSMDVRTHVYETSLPEPADKAEFERFISKLISRPLDERRPLWEAYLIENGGEGDGNAVAFRLNHSIGDGFALLSVLLGLVDNPDEIELPVGGIPDPPTVDRGMDDSPAQGDTVTDHSPAQGDEGTAGPEESAADTPADRSETQARHSDSGSSGGLNSIVEGTKYAVEGVKSAYRLLTMGDDTQTSLHGQIGTRKQVAWTEDIDIERVKRICNAHDTTVNDVLLGATAGALRRVFEERDEPTDGLEVRCTMPVNLKGMDDRDTSLGNYFGLAFIPIPVGKCDLTERIRTVRKRTSRKRIGTEAYLMYLLLEIGGYLPYEIQKEVMRFFKRRSLGVFTNVPGPTNTLKFAGREITDVMFWVPQSIDQGMGISIFSYDGGVRMGVNSDVNLLEDPQNLTDALETEIEMLAEDVD